MNQNSIAFLFAGSLAGYGKEGMGYDFYQESPVARAIFDIGEIFRPGTLNRCFTARSGEKLPETDAQPCAYLTGLAIAASLADAGVVPAVTAGYSVGELTALAYAGVVTDADGFRLATVRGSESESCARRYPCVLTRVLNLDPVSVCAVASEFTDIYPTAFECEGQITVAGSAAEMPAFCAAVTKLGGLPVPKSGNGCYHTPYMATACAAMTGALAYMTVSPSRLPVFANTTGLPYPGNPNAVKDMIADGIMTGVRFCETLRNMAGTGISTFITVGDDGELAGFVRRTVDGARVLPVTCLSDFETVVSTVKMV